MDIYSFGAMLYELLSGFPPFFDVLGNDQPFVAYRAAAMTRTPTDVHERLARSPLLPLASLAMKCLAIAPSERPSLEEIASALDPIAARCVCSQCGGLDNRDASTFRGAGWICGRCKLKRAFAVLNDLAQDVARPEPAGRWNVEDQGPAVERPQVTSGIDSLRRDRVLEESCGVRSTLARDELDREVVLHELLPAASAAEREQFRAAVACLGASNSTALPRVFRADDVVLVLEHVPVQGLDGTDRSDLAQLVPAMLALIRATEACHQRGFALGLRESTISVRKRPDRIDLVAIDWRAIQASGQAAPSPWQVHELRGASQDVRALDDIFTRLLAGHAAKSCSTNAAKCPATHHATTAFRSLGEEIVSSRAAHTMTSADSLGRIATRLTTLAATARCHRCAKRVSIDSTPISGRGYTCAECALEIARTPGAELDLVFSHQEQDDLLLGYRKLFWRTLAAALIATVGIALAFVAQVRVNGWVVIGVMVMYGTAFHHRSQWADFLRRKSTRSMPATEQPVVRQTPEEAADELRRFTRRSRISTGLMVAFPISILIAFMIPRFSAEIEESEERGRKGAIESEQKRRAWDAERRAEALEAATPKDISHEALRRIYGTKYNGRGRPLMMSGYLETAEGGVGPSVTITLDYPAPRMRVSWGPLDALNEVLLDGAHAWRRTGGATPVELPADQVERLRFELWKHPDLLLRHYKDVRLQFVGTDAIDGRPHSKFTMTSPFATKVTVEVDDATHLISRISTTSDGQTASEALRDYKGVRGIRVPLTRTISGNSAVFGPDPIRIKLGNVVVDPPIDDKTFAP